jgi:hypothetical protein
MMEEPLVHCRWPQIRSGWKTADPLVQHPKNGGRLVKVVSGDGVWPPQLGGLLNGYADGMGQSSIEACSVRAIMAAGSKSISGKSKPLCPGSSPRPAVNLFDPAAAHPA